MPKATLSPTTIRVTPLQRAHADLIARLSNLRPSTIRGAADAADIETRAEHLHGVYGAFAAYIDAVVDDTIDHLVTIEDVDLTRVDIIIGDACNEGPPTWWPSSSRPAAASATFALRLEGHNHAQSLRHYPPKFLGFGEAPLPGSARTGNVNRARATSPARATSSMTMSSRGN